MRGAFIPVFRVQRSRWRIFIRKRGTLFSPLEVDKYDAIILLARQKISCIVVTVIHFFPFKLHGPTYAS